MFTLMLGDTVDPLIRQVDGQSALLPQKIAISLEPFRAAAARQKALGDDYIRPVAWAAQEASTALSSGSWRPLGYSQDRS